MKRRPSKEARERLAANLLEALRHRPYTILELAAAFNFSHHTVRERLRALLLAGRVHYVEVPTKGNLGMAHVWHIGEADPEQIQLIAGIQDARTARPDLGPITQPRQETVRQYPAVGRRDPLVAALFGPAGSLPP